MRRQLKLHLVTFGCLLERIAKLMLFAVVIGPSIHGCESTESTAVQSNPTLPTVTTISPACAVAGGAGFTLAVDGTNFDLDSVVNFGEMARATTFVSSTHLTAPIPADAIASGGYAVVSVFEHRSGGGSSKSMFFTITTPQRELCVSPLELFFGNQAINTTSTPRTVTLTNMGSAPFTLYMAINGFHYGDFAQTNDCPAEIPAGVSCTVSVTFTPTARGDRIGILVINGDLPDEVWVDFIATGT
jgi:hypothetical protein